MYTNVIFLSAMTAMASRALASSSVPPPDAPIPELYRDSVLQAWDNSIIRFRRDMTQFSPDIYKNTAFDQAIGGNGAINVCVRWNSNTTVTETTRQQVESQYRKLYNFWWEWLPGYDNFPFDEIKINFVGWAVRDRNQLQGSLDGLDVYTEFKDDQGLPDCNPACWVEDHLDGNFTACPGGRDHRYHQFFLLNSAWGDMNMGAAIGYGIDVSMYGWETVGSKMGYWPLLLHEMGHTIGFLDYLDLEGNAPPNGTNPLSVCSTLFLPPNHPENFVMKPGNGGSLTPPTVTEMEGWMIRYWWTRISRLRGWQADNTTYPPLPDCPSENFDKRSSHHFCSL